MIKKIFISILPLFIFSCFLEENRLEETLALQRKGSLTVNLPKTDSVSASRALPTSSDVDYFRVSVTGNNYSDSRTSSYGSVTFSDLAEGTYSIEVEAYKNGPLDYSGYTPAILLFSGTNTATIQAGSTTTVTINLDYESEINTGELDININFPSSYTPVNNYTPVNSYTPVYSYTPY